jgi:hypothetical protein
MSLRKIGMNLKEAVLACLIVPSQRFHGEMREDSKRLEQIQT